MNDILVATDRGKYAVLVLLDMTAAFGSADHSLYTRKSTRAHNRNYGEL